MVHEAAHKERGLNARYQVVDAVPVQMIVKSP